MVKAVSNDMLDAIDAALPEELSTMGVVCVCGLIITRYATNQEDGLGILTELIVQMKKYYVDNDNDDNEQCGCAACVAERRLN
jgi:hypothetical protein